MQEFCTGISIPRKLKSNDSSTKSAEESMPVNIPGHEASVDKVASSIATPQSSVSPNAMSARVVVVASTAEVDDIIKQQDPCPAPYPGKVWVPIWALMDVQLNYKMGE